MILDLSSGSGVRWANRSHHLPEQAVVIVATAVVSHGCRVVFYVFHDGDDISISRRWIELVDVGLMMLRVMNVHCFFVNERLEHLIVVWQRWQSEIVAHFWLFWGNLIFFLMFKKNKIFFCFFVVVVGLWCK